MALHLRQGMDLRLEQKLKLTPQMIQSIEILLLPQMALEERIMNEVESNPALEILDGPEEDGPDAAPAREETSGGEDPDGPAAPTMEVLRGEDWDHELWADSLKQRRAADDEDAPDKMEAIAATAGPLPTLADHLLDQLRFVDAPESVRALLPDLCWALDRRGWLVDDLVELFGEERLELAEHALELVRACEPAGVGARGIADCLLLQLAREPGDNRFDMRVVRHHLDDLLRNRLPAIAQAMGCEVDRVQETLEVIKTLDPQPGIAFGRIENSFVVPDVLLERDETGDWTVEIPDGHLPKIQVSQAYHQLYEDDSLDHRDRSYLKEKLAGARFIIDAVAQRKRTLLRIVTEIVKHQRAFLEFGPEHLRPLMRQDIADKIGMHVATVSRAVKDKYAQTPGGTIPLANFFSGGIATQDGGEAESSKAVRLKIKAMLEREDARVPLSDQAIADQLAKEGLDISRRTVTKYRIAMNLGSTRQRRRFAD